MVPAPHCPRGSPGNLHFRRSGGEERQVVAALIIDNPRLSPGLRRAG